MSFDYDSVAGDYQYHALDSKYAMQRFWHRGKLSVIDELVRPHLRGGSRVLEIGCGSGNLLLQALVPGSYAVGLDLAMASLAFVRSRLRDRSSGPNAPAGAACIQGACERLPLADGSFDCVLLSEVIEHLPAPQIAIGEACRVLRPGGRLLVTTPNYRSLWPVLERTVDWLDVTPKMAGEQHISRLRPASLRTLLDEAGLRLEHFGTIYGISPFLALFSAGMASRRLAYELANRSSFGMILVAVAAKPRCPDTRDRTAHAPQRSVEPLHGDGHRQHRSL